MGKNKADSAEFRGKRWVQIALVGILLCSALYTRTTNWSGTFVDDQVFFGGLDSYFHMRRVHLTVDQYPQVPTFDTFANFPEGNMLCWPIGFDLVVGTLGKIARMADDSAWVVEFWAALFSSLMGVLTCLLIFFATRKIAGHLAACCGLGLAAILPFFSNYSMVGRLDHHSIEALILLIPLISLLNIEGSARQRRWGAVRTGILLGLCFGFWQGSIFVSFLVALSCIPGLLSRSEGDHPMPNEMAERGSLIFISATLAVIPITLLHPWAYQGSFAYLAPTWFNPTFLFLAFCAFYSFEKAQKKNQSLALSWGLFFLSPILLGGLLALYFDELRHTLVLAWEYVGRGEAQISQVEESFPLFQDGFSKARTQYTWLIYAAPLLFISPLSSWRKERIGFRISYLWLCVSAVLATLQLRQGTLFAPLWCMGWGIAAQRIYSALVVRMNKPVPVGAGLIVLASIILFPTFSIHKPLRVYGTQQFTRSLDSLLWLRDHAASPGDSMRPTETPDFSVMARWQWGHWLSHIAKQANVANPLGQTPDALRGVRDSVNYFIERDPSKAEEILKRRKSRYVMVSPLLSELEPMLKHSDETLSTFLKYDEKEGPIITAEWSKMMNTRLHHFDGRSFSLGGEAFAPLRTMRLMYEGQVQTQEAGRRLSYIKIFERVGGAKLRGTVQPGQLLFLETTIQTNLGRSFQYRDKVVADSEGNFRITVPYSTGQKPGGVRVGPYIIFSAKEAQTKLHIGEEQVLTGADINLNIPAKQ